MKILTARNLWLEELRVRGCSPSTLKVYAIHTDEAIKEIASFLEASPSDTHLKDISRDSIISALSSYRSRTDKRSGKIIERSGVSVGRHLSAIKSFLNWCVETEKLERNVSSQIRAPKIAKRVPKALPVEDCMKLLNAASESQWPTRDRLLILSGVALGLRLAEITSLQLDSFYPNIENPTHVKVLGKGSKERTVPVPLSVRKALSAYLETRKKKLDISDGTTQALFLSRSPHVKDGSPSWDATHDGLGQVFERLLEKAGLKKPGIRAHATRHSFAAIALSSRAFDLEELRQTLGHSSLATTQGYLSVDPQRLSEASELHPMGGLE